MPSLPPRPVTPTPARNDQEAVREIVGMRKWMRLTARKHSASKQSDNDAAQAAADALNALLRESRKIG